MFEIIHTKVTQLHEKYISYIRHSNFIYFGAPFCISPWGLEFLETALTRSNALTLVIIEGQNMSQEQLVAIILL